MVVIFDIDLLEDKIKKELIQVAKKYKELLNNSPPNLPNIQSCIK